MNTCLACGKMKHNRVMQGCTCQYSMQAQPAYRAVKTVHEGKPVYVAQHDEDDDTQGFLPDWANFQEGRAVGWTEAFERIAEKVKSLPWENDTKDSFLIWLEEQK